MSAKNKTAATELSVAAVYFYLVMLELGIVARQIFSLIFCQDMPSELRLECR